MKKHALDIYDALRDVYKSFNYWLITFITLIIFILFLFWLHNKDLLIFITGSDLFSFQTKIKLIFNAFSSLGVHYTVWMLFISVFIAVFSATNITFMFYFIRRRIKMHRVSGLGAVAVFIGLFGLGCSACGSVLLSSLIGITAATSLMGYLPYNGKEIGVIAIIILAISNYLILYKIKNPPTCKIKK